MFKIMATFLFLLLSILFSCAVANEGDNISSSSLTAWVQGTNTQSGEAIKIYFSNESDSEIVLRELKDVSVHCEADYAVQLDFDSHTGFRLLATGAGSSSKFFSNGTHESNVQQHTTYAHLVSLKEAFTGLYTCKGRGSNTKNNSISAYIYVPSKKLFVSTMTAMISSQSDPLVIPCPIADPNATVTLVKLHEQDVIMPVPTASYSPKIGFTLPNSSNGDSNETNVDGIYYCIAKSKQNHRAVEFTVVKGPVICTKRCSENSKCQLVNEQQVCECKPGWTETLVSEKCLIQCRTDNDCPSNLACMPQDSGSFLLEILSSVEGRTSGEVGEDVHYQKIGECKNPCIYRTTTCSLGASRNTNEVCRVKEHAAICSVSN